MFHSHLVIRFVEERGHIHSYLMLMKTMIESTTLIREFMSAVHNFYDHLMQVIIVNKKIVDFIRRFLLSHTMTQLQQHQ